MHYPYVHESDSEGRIGWSQATVDRSLLGVSFSAHLVSGLSSRVVSISDCGVRIQVRITPLTVVFIATAAAIYSRAWAVHLYLSA